MYRFLLALTLAIFAAILYKFNNVIETEPRYFLYSSVLIMVIVNVVACYIYIRGFKKNSLYFSHGVIFALLTALAAIHAVDYMLGHEMIATMGRLTRRVVYIQVLAAFFLIVPTVAERLLAVKKQVHYDYRWRPEIIALYLFVAIYPVQYYVANNVEAFSLELIIQFTLIACSVPALVFIALHYYLRPVMTDRTYYIVNLLAAIAIFASYMKPLYRDLSILASDVLGFTSDEFSIYIPVFIILFLLGYKFRSIVAPFLFLMLALNLVNLGYNLYISDSSEHKSINPRVTNEMVLYKNPSIYMLVVDAYQNIEGLKLKGLEDLYVGPVLLKRGFNLYEKAYSNYKSSVESLRSFFEIEHHYYNPDPDWQALMTGNNKLYSVLNANGYSTVVAHPSDYLLQGNCNSDRCYPASSLFGEIGFILSETIHYKTNFTNKTAIGKGKYRKDLFQMFEEMAAPAIFYSHVLAPDHGPRGCNDSLAVLKDYEQGLVTANEWINSAIDKIESVDDNAIIMILGDHGALLADGCTWSNPDVTSIETITDNLGVLLAVKWPEDYDNRYDANIHTLMDLSWYLLQYLSEEGMDEDLKPASASYLMREQENLVYKVTQDGIFTPGSRGFKRSDIISTVNKMDQRRID